MISIIIPTLNEENYIETLLKSLERQTYLNFEIIIVDGSSDDGTVSKANKYSEKFDIKILTGNEKNVSKQKNIGAKSAKGDILFFLDADIIIPRMNFLEIVARKFYKENVKAAVPKLYISPKEERFFDRVFYIGTNSFVKIFNALGGFGTYGVQAVKKDIFESVNGFNENIRIAEDVDLFRRVRKKTRIKFMDDVKLYTSGRRLREEGYRKVLWEWISNGFSVIFLKKPLNRGYKPVR